MLASYTSGQPSKPRRHPTCWASSQWSHTVSSTPWHGAWTSAPLSAHLSIECKRTAPQIETPICTRRTTTHQLMWQQQHTCSALWTDYQWNARWGDNPKRLRIFNPDTGTPPWNDHPKKSLGPAQPPPHPCRTFPLLLVQMGHGLLCDLWVWRRKTNLSTMLSSSVLSIDLLMDCTAWQFWAMRQPNGCSKPAPRSSAAKLCIERTGSKYEEQGRQVAVLLLRSLCPCRGS